MPLQNPQYRERTLEAFQIAVRAAPGDGGRGRRGRLVRRRGCGSVLTTPSMMGWCMAAGGDPRQHLRGAGGAHAGRPARTGADRRIQDQLPACRQNRDMRCRSTVPRQGRSLTASEAEVFADGPDRSILVAKALATIALVVEC